MKFFTIYFTLSCYLRKPVPTFAKIWVFVYKKDNCLAQNCYKYIFLNVRYWYQIVAYWQRCSTYFCQNNSDFWKYYLIVTPSCRTVGRAGMFLRIFYIQCLIYVRNVYFATFHSWLLRVRGFLFCQNLLKITFEYVLIYECMHILFQFKFFREMFSTGVCLSVVFFHILSLPLFFPK